MNRLFVSFLVIAACREAIEERTSGLSTAVLERELVECRAQLASWGSMYGGATSTAVPSFTTWKTLQLGTDQPTDPAAELESRGFRVSDWARELLAKTSFATEPTTVDLVEVSVAELGFSNFATTAEIYERALFFDLMRVSAEVGYRLRKELTDEPVGTWRCIGMEPIAVSDGSPLVFRVDHDDVVRWLGTSYANPTLQWVPEIVWVFGRSKPR